MHRSLPRIASAWLMALAVALPSLAAESIDPVAVNPLVRVLPLQDLAGRTWGAEELAGKVVMVDFWATWCTPCLAELPHQKRAYGTYHQNGFEILAISLDQTDRRSVERWIRTHEIPWPQFHDNRGFNGEQAVAFEVETLPRSFLFDRAGRLVATDLRGDAFEAAIAAMLRLADPSDP